MDLLIDLHESGATLCIVTHEPRYAEDAERTVHLFDGRLVNEGDNAAVDELGQAGFGTDVAQDPPHPPTGMS